MGAFADAAAEYSRLGLMVTPTWGTDGKRPLMKGYAKRHLRGPAMREVAEKFPNANIAIITGPSGLDVIDIDDPSLLQPMMIRFGETPLITKTAGRGGYQLFYRHSEHVRAANLRASEGLPVEVRTGANIVIAPPSRSPITGRYYEFVAGRFDERTLASLPQLPVPRIFNTKSKADHHRVTQGHRNDWLFQQCMRAAHHVDDFSDLLDVGHTRNDELDPPLEDLEVQKVVRSAWKYQTEGRNFVGGSSNVVLSREDIEVLCTADPGSPIGLHLRLKLEHGARVERGETFALSRRAMAKAGTFKGWSEKQIRRAIANAESVGLISRVNDANAVATQYTLGKLTGPKSGPNVT